MKVLHVISDIDEASGGTTSYMVLLSQYLGLMCDLHIVAGVSPHPVTVENAAVHFIAFGPLARRKVMEDFDKVLDEVKPDVVHINGIWLPWMWWMQLRAQVRGIRVALTPHGMLEPWIMRRHPWKKQFAMWLYQRRAIAAADVLHATAASEANNIRRLGFRNPITVIPNGVDVANIALRESWQTTRTILYLSRIHPKKGIENLIAAVAMEKERLAGWRVLIAGQGEPDYIASLKKRVAFRELEDMIEFTGGVYGRQKWELMQQADFFILPTFSENFGIVVVEALASGTPVIATTGAPWEELSMCGCGWWVDNDPPSLARTLLEAVSFTPEKRREMGLKGRKLVEDNYSSQTMARQMVALYEQMAEKDAIG